MKTTHDRFYEKIYFSPDGCWYWAAAWTAKTGYGKFTICGDDVDSHRASYIIHKGKIPKGMVIMHTCDNKLCVNPDHLVMGTQADNIRDAVSKGRNPKGSSSGLSKVTEVQVMAMRDAYRAGHSVKNIANYFKLKTP